MNKAQLGVVGAVAWVALGCSSSYEPARSPRVSMIYDGGQIAFVKNGVHYNGLLPGNSLIDAVDGDPQAESEAHAARNLEVGGFVVSLGGLGAVGSAIVVQANSHPADANNGLVGGLVLSALACEIVSISLTLSSIPHFYDAINIYNDNVDRAFAPPPLVPIAPVPAPASKLTPANVASAPAPAPAAPPAKPPSAQPTSPAAPPSAAFPAQ